MDRGWLYFSDTTTFEEVLADVKRQFEQELAKEKIAMHIERICAHRKESTGTCCTAGNQEILSDDSETNLGSEKHHRVLFQHWNYPLSGRV